MMVYMTENSNTKANIDLISDIKKSFYDEHMVSHVWFQMDLVHAIPIQLPFTRLNSNNHPGLNSFLL